MPLDEKSRLEKEAYAQKIMAEMKLKNEKLKERYMEVQRDRERAEERNSSVTTGRNAKKEAEKEIVPKAKKEREWDRGKPNPDSVDWDSSEHHDYYSRNTRSYSDRRVRKDDSWRSRSTNSSSKPTSSFFSKYHSNKNETIPESSTYRSDTNRFNNRPRSQYHSSNPIKGRATSESNHHSYQNSKIHDHSKKSSEERFSSSANYSESKKEPVRSSMDDGLDELMWQCGSMNEVQHKLSRIENWVKSININQGFTETNDTINKEEDFKSEVKCKDVGFHSERPRKYGSVEDSSTKKSEEQTHFRMKEKSEHKFNPSLSKSRGRGNRMTTGDRCSSVSDSNNPGDVKRKNVGERCRRKCESDISDRASSLKESDDFDWGKGKVIPARSNSKSSENSYGRGRGKEIHFCKEKSMEPSDSGRFDNLKSNESTKFKTNAWNEERHEETANKKSTFRQNFPQDNKHKYGSKSLPSHDSSKNPEYKSNSYQRSSWKKTNDCMKDNKFQNNKSVSGLVSSSRDINGEKELSDSENLCTKFTSDQINIGGTDPELEKKNNEFECTADPYSVSEIWEDSNSDCQIIDKKNKELEFTADSYSKSEIWENSNSDCQIIDKCNDCHDSQKRSVDNEVVSKFSGILLSGAQNEDCIGFDSPSSKENSKKVNSDSDCQVIDSSVYDNSFLQDDMNCSDIYKKNMESAENIIISLQCTQNDFQIPNRRRVSVKRYSHKNTLSKTVKHPQKSKLFVDSLKVTNKSLKTNIYSKYQNKVSHSDSENSVHDKSPNISFSNENTGEPGAKPVSERKPILTDNIKLCDETNKCTLNLSDDDWSTVSDDEDENVGIDLIN